MTTVTNQIASTADTAAAATSTTKKVADKSMLTKVERAQYDACTSVASKVRLLLSLGKSRGDISRYMTEAEGKLVRYQWVRNIELTPLKKA